MLDVGNQAHEGSYDWQRADQLLGAHWSHLGVKDVRISGRERTWCPSDEGSSDFEQVARGWQRRQRPGSWVLMPFYHADDNDAHLAALSKGVQAACPIGPDGPVGGHSMSLRYATPTTFVRHVVTAVRSSHRPPSAAIYAPIS